MIIGGRKRILPQSTIHVTYFRFQYHVAGMGHYHE
jgi:hypothetical protein